MAHQDQLVGESLPNWESAKLPSKKTFIGQFCICEPLDIHKHAKALYQAFTEDNTDGRSWTYLPYGPFENASAFLFWLESWAKNPSDPVFYAILSKHTNQAIGMTSYLRIAPENGVIEMGHVHFSQRLKKTPIATEAMYFFMRHVFDDLGYRRYEWKCDSLNEASFKAAQRLGFQFEGVFRQDRIYKNRSRDTAWFSIIDKEWSALKKRFEAWLDPTNFDEYGKQRKALAEFSL